jgi:hypothetical protein
MLPKTHKDPPRTGRPIISGIGCPTERGSSFLQVFLAGVVRAQFTYLKDTRHFITSIEGRCISPSQILVALDVNNMYTEIPLDEAEISVMDAVFQLGFTEVKGIRLPPTLAFRSLLHICLTRNNFQFAGSQYLQIRGVPMGSKFSPEVADIVGFCLERRIFAMFDSAIGWSRFRDDCFMILSLEVSSVENLLEKCNAAHPTLKFKIESSSRSLPFLDTEVYVREGALAVRLYRKPSYAFQYLLRSSCHPVAVFMSLVRGECLRIARNSSSLSDFQHHVQVFAGKLVFRGYKRTMIDSIIGTVDYTGDRARQLQDRVAVTLDRSKLVCVMPYYPQFAPRLLRSVLQEHWHVIAADPAIGHIFHTVPILGFRRGKNLASFLVRARFS